MNAQTSSSLKTTVAPGQQSRHPSSSRSKQDSWVHRDYTAHLTESANPKVNIKRTSLPSLPTLKRSQSSFSTPEHSRSRLQWRGQSHASPTARPRTSHGFKLGLHNSPRTLPSGELTLPTIVEQKETHAADTLESGFAGLEVRQWDGRTRTFITWDGLQRDPELWFERGNCFIHLYAKGQPQRGPSFRVPLDEIQAAGFESFFGLFYNEVLINGRKDFQNFDGIGLLANSAFCDIYMPAPSYSSKHDSLSWHITTRNFFAFLFRKPLVGASLSKVMIDLQERLILLRSAETSNQTDMLSYLKHMGYLEFAHCPDYSLALLAYSEFYKQEGLWVDAFVHCVGMCHTLTLSSEFEKISRATKALIFNAFLEMDHRHQRVIKALSDFLEEDLSLVNLRLSNSARSHLKDFRSFLQTYYIKRFGYWPIPEGAGFSKAVCKTMYFDFGGLYDYLVNSEAEHSLLDRPLTASSTYLLQNLQAFNTRHKYIPLPHMFPLLPDHSEGTPETLASRVLFPLKRRTKLFKIDKTIKAKDALFAATNSTNTALMHMPLVKAYSEFEQQHSMQHKENLSLNDGRKVRWMLVYSTLQMLFSIMQAPKEVRDVDNPTYPLHCLVADIFPWESGPKAVHDKRMGSNDLKAQTVAVRADKILPTRSLFLKTRLSFPSDPEATDCSGHTSLLPNMASNTVSDGRCTSGTAKPSAPKFSEILVRGYGNGLRSAVGKKNIVPSELSSEILPEILLSPIPVAPLPEKARSTPACLKHRTYGGQLVTPFYTAPSPSRTPSLDSSSIDRPHIDGRTGTAWNGKSSTDNALLRSPHKRTSSVCTGVESSFSVNSCIEKEEAVHEMLAEVPFHTLATTKRHLQVHLPSGVPFENRAASADVPGEEKAGSPRRNNAVWFKRRSLRIR